MSITLQSFCSWSAGVCTIIIFWFTIHFIALGVPKQVYAKIMMLKYFGLKGRVAWHWPTKRLIIYCIAIVILVFDLILYFMGVVK